jgi:hypothetical protein
MRCGIKYGGRSTGEWKIELWYKETKLVEKTFTVYVPETK